MNFGKAASQSVSRVWGVIGALLLTSVAGAFSWLLVQGIRRGEIFTLSKRHRSALVTLHDNPGMFWFTVTSYVVVVVLILWMAVLLLRSLRKPSTTLTPNRTLERPEVIE